MRRLVVRWVVGLPVLLVALVLASPGSDGAETAAARKPNVVFILADDLGYTDLACFGSGYYVTPNIDRMAAEGMKLTASYSCGPNCQPSRAALMSGQYGPRTGVYTVGSIDRFNWRSRSLRPVDNVAKLPLDKVTIAQALKSAGYATGMFGKWHLGQQDQYHPSHRGFDEAIVSMGKHFNFVTSPAESYPEGTYLADFLTDKAVDFITRHKAEPFFLYLPHFGVHSPHEAKKDLIKKFAGKPPKGGHHDPVYAAMIASVDESVGRVLKTLEDLKLSDETLVIFSSDNGGVGGYVREGIAKKPDVTDNAPLRGGKGMLYEGGVRVAHVVRWPGKIPAGTVCDRPINGVDLYPTLLELAGAKPAADYPLDGTSYLGLMTSGGKGSWDRDTLYWHFPGYLGIGAGNWRTTPAGSIRVGDWKLLEFFETGKLELYNTRDDLGEKHDLAATDPDRVKALHAKLVDWRKQIKAPMPTPITAKDRAEAGSRPRARKKKARRN